MVWKEVNMSMKDTPNSSTFKSFVRDTDIIVDGIEKQVRWKMPRNKRRNINRNSWEA